MRPNYRQNAQWTFRNRSQSRNRNENYNNDYTRGRSRDRHDNRPIQQRREESRSQSNTRVITNHDCMRCYRCREYDHFASECPNTPTDEEMDYEDADPVSVQMLTQNYCPFDPEGEAEYLNLKRQEWHHPILPPKEKTGGKVSYVRNKEAMCLTER